MSAAPVRTRTGIRILVCIGVCLLAVIGFYMSLLASANRLSGPQWAMVHSGIDVLRQKGFDDEVMMLSRFTVFRSDDHWLNATVAKENAYAATNFPFEIMTLYSDFFTYPEDDVERAAILLHEARHLFGDDEHAAYKFVWLNRGRLGWTGAGYADSPVWRNIRQQTREQVPELFTCPENEVNDCTGL